MSEKVSLRYVGPHDAVEVEAADGSWHVVERDSTKEFPADVAKSLLEQEGNWERAGGRKTKKSEEGE